MPAFPRVTALYDRHIALGSDMSTAWNDMAISQNYATDPYEETAVTRTKAGLIEVTALNLVLVKGPGATDLLNYMLTTDIAKAAPGDSHISNIVNENGGLVDDVLVYVLEPNVYRLSHGSGATGATLKALAPKYDVTIEPDDTHVLSLQGPLSAAVLQPHTPLNLDTLGYFKHAPTTLFGKSIQMARGGYSGERGYEVFCTRADAVFLWDAILEAGQPHGVMSVSWTCLDIVRVESGLLFFPFDMPHTDTTPWEVKADWTVDLSKPDFIGKAALAASKGKERSVITGLEVWHSAAITPGAKVKIGGRDVGVITSTVFSQHLMKSLTMAQIEKGYTAFGTALEIEEDGKTYPATVVRMPFYDPMRLRTHG
jgi:aminomethyltransferase